LTLPHHDTTVSYPSGELITSATVLHTEPLPDRRIAILLDRTTCHPVDAGWPDQGPDRAVLRLESERGVDERPVVDCVVGATDGSVLYLGRDIPVPKGTDGWAFVVVHIVDGQAVTGAGRDDTAAPAEGDTVHITVDGDYRHALSAGHTACHLASLALNRAVADRWRKEIRPDGLGNPDFDGTANDVSLIREFGSIDTYRLGKSLRKKGFSTDGLAEALPHIEAAVNASLAGWVATDAAVRVDRDGDGLTDRRSWVCELPEHPVRIPCGGTHLTSLGELGGLRAQLSVTDVDGTMVLTMNTSSV
jgi:Ser-tRNA(Ala) deacylase AlaX